MRLFLIIVLAVSVGAKFPPDAFTNLTTDLPLHFKPDKYEVIMKSNGMYVNYLADKRGDRLKLNKTQHMLMAMYIVNDGYVFKNEQYSDILCLYSYGGIFRMLNRPNSNKMPKHCIFQIKQVSGAKSNQTLRFEYTKDNRLCVIKSDIPTDAEYVLYIDGYYLVVNSGLSSTTNENRASRFSFLYNTCFLDNPETTTNHFLCRISGTGYTDTCDAAKQYVVQYANWKMKLINSLITSTTTSTTSTTTTTTLKPHDDYDDDDEETTTVTTTTTSKAPEFIWCEYASVLCSNSAASQIKQQALYLALIFIIYKINRGWDV
ncbi:hypothetical protein SlGVgp119 [Spodoptera litura granulovirus]|uniref:Fgf-1 n=1 Tax=Spodoptera litura granulovirus TaxID=359919 RepID=A5IZX1_9BBAC|nr:hypothetical protein SlGVgp119 [Spodoptera litura granulovirus]ABQ52062.1 hypothetical protein SlGVgp119 [Spodoptera litura granulovirus]